MLLEVPVEGTHYLVHEQAVDGGCIQLPDGRFVLPSWWGAEFPKQLQPKELIFLADPGTARVFPTMEKFQAVPGVTRFIELLEADSRQALFEATTEVVLHAYAHALSGFREGMIDAEDERIQLNTVLDELSSFVRQHSVISGWTPEKLDALMQGAASRRMSTMSLDELDEAFDLLDLKALREGWSDDHSRALFMTPLSIWAVSEWRRQSGMPPLDRI